MKASLFVLSLIACTFSSFGAEPPTIFKWGEGTRVLLVGGGSSHNFEKFFHKSDEATLKAMGNVSVNYTEKPADVVANLKDADVLGLSANQNGIASPEVRKAIEEFVASGKGVVLMHPGLWSNFNNWPEFNRELAGGGARSHDRFGEFEVTVTKSDSPIMKDVPATFKITDELYQSKIDPKGTPVEVLATTSTSLVTKQSHPSVWIVKHPKAKIVAIALGHDDKAHDHPAYKKLLQNSVKWVSGK